jgi:hypothetical protein
VAVQDTLIQDIVQKLDDLEQYRPVEQTLEKLQGALDQFGATWEASPVTFYVKDPWRNEYVLRHLSGVRRREFMWNPPGSGVVFARVLGVLGSRSDRAKSIREDHYIFWARSPGEKALGAGAPAWFVSREGVASTAVLYAFRQGASPRQDCNALLFVNWRSPQMVDPWRDSKAWIRLFSQSLHGAVEKLVRHSVPHPEILGRHLALADKLGSDLPRIVAGGPQEMARRFAELAGGKTDCTIHEVRWACTGHTLRQLASTLRSGGPREGTGGFGGDLPRIIDKAVEIKGVIYVDDFEDADWRQSYRRPSGSVVSQLAMPILESHREGPRARYIVSLYRPKADAFSYEEIRLLRESANHIKTVFNKASEAMDAAFHDPCNIVMALDPWRSQLDGNREGPSVRDVFALSQIMQWSAGNSALLTSAVCGLPTECERSSIQSKVGPIVRWIKRAERLLNENVKITAEVAKDISTDVPGVFGQVLWNLVHNAGKFANVPSPEIGIVVRRDGSFIHLVVEDNGPGLDEAEVNTIWLPSWSGGTGKGWGLFIVKACAEAVGGRVKAGNRPAGAKGARFEVWLPAA